MGYSCMLAALRAAQDLLQPGGLLETSFSLKAKSSYKLVLCYIFVMSAAGAVTAAAAAVLLL